MNGESGKEIGKLGNWGRNRFLQTIAPLAITSCIMAVIGTVLVQIQSSVKLFLCSISYISIEIAIQVLYIALHGH